MPTFLTAAPVLAAAAHTATSTASHHAASTGFALPHIRYLAILPVIVMLGGAVAILGVTSLVRRPLRVRVATIGTVVVSGTALGFALWQWSDVLDHGPFTAIDHALVVDGFSVLVAILVPCAMLLTALVADGYLRREGITGPEFHVLALISAAGAMIMAEANDLIIVFLGLEILSLALYVLAAFNHKRAASGEASLKYFILGGFSSAVFLYGIALTYGATGSTNLVQIADFLSHNVLASDGLLLAGLALLLVGFCFKVAAVPFHMWTPDVYEGSPSPATGFMAAVAKVGGFAALLRVFVSTFGTLRADWQPVVYAIAIVTLLLGAGLAVVQRDVKRMLAYSSINHAGFVLLGLEAATTKGVSAALYYLFAYTFMVIGTFAVVTVLGRDGDGNHDIASYRGLAKRQPLLALSLAVLLLAQAGAPFTTGLWAKLQVVIAAVDANSVPLAVVAMVSAAIAAFFYLRVAVLMYTPLPAPGSVSGDEPDAEAPEPLTAGDVGPADLPGATGPHTPDLGAIHSGPAPTPVWAGTPGLVAATTQRNAALLLDDDPVTVVEEEEPAADVVPVPALTAVAIGLCVAVTVVFGIIPGPLVDLAHQATLLFVP
jgi:NADH-quinone oxidoreductase subunit N